MRNIDIATVRAFLTVVEVGSVTKAARFLNLSQGAISQQLRRLEEFSEAPLFRRDGRRLALAPKGQAVLAAARHYVGANEALAAALHAPAFQGEVKFGAPYDIIGSWTPPILRRCPTAISNAGKPAAATRINISRFQPYVMSVMPRRSSTSRRIARNGGRSLKRAP
jgi:molybdenum-dependent DNA-binding transcriptional regulator ModE